jgi:hypothetical protein
MKYKKEKPGAINDIYTSLTWLLTKIIVDRYFMDT